MYIKFCFEHQKGGGHMEYRVLDERLILKMLILGKGCGIHAAQDGYWRNASSEFQ